MTFTLGRSKKRKRKKPQKHERTRSPLSPIAKFFNPHRSPRSKTPDKPNKKILKRGKSTTNHRKSKNSFLKHTKKTPLSIAVVLYAEDLNGYPETFSTPIQPNDILLYNYKLENDFTDDSSSSSSNKPSNSLSILRRRKSMNTKKNTNQKHEKRQKRKKKKIRARARTPSASPSATKLKLSTFSIKYRGGRSSVNNSPKNKKPLKKTKKNKKTQARKSSKSITNLPPPKPSLKLKTHSFLFGSHLVSRRKSQGIEHKNEHKNELKNGHKNELKNGHKNEHKNGHKNGHKMLRNRNGGSHVLSLHSPVSSRSIRSLSQGTMYDTIEPKPNSPKDKTTRFRKYKSDDDKKITFTQRMSRSKIVKSIISNVDDSGYDERRWFSRRNSYKKSISEKSDDVVEVESVVQMKVSVSVVGRKKKTHHKRNSSGIPHFYQKKMQYEVEKYLDEKARVCVTFWCRIYRLRISEMLFEIISDFHSFVFFIFAFMESFF